MQRSSLFDPNIGHLIKFIPCQSQILFHNFCYLFFPLLTHQFISVTQSCLILCDPMNHSTSGLPVHRQLPESTQTHVHWVDDVIQPSHPLSSPSPPALSLSQHQGFFFFNTYFYFYLFWNITLCTFSYYMLIWYMF